MKSIALDELKPHPKNPRLAPRADVIDQIAAQINGEFDPAHALIVRKNCEGYEIISGHHRALAARKAGLKEVPCWVRELSDDDAYMALALNNAQGELSELEVGVHALHSSLSGSEYARRIGVAQGNVKDRICAARVGEASGYPLADLRDQWSALAALHQSPQWLWRALASRLVAEGWTVETARKEASRFKDVKDLPGWVDLDKLAENLLSGAVKVGQVSGFASILKDAEGTLRAGKDDAERLTEELHAKLAKAKPSLPSEVTKICTEAREEQRELIRIREQADFLRQEAEEQRQAKLARHRRNVSLDEWKTLSEVEHADLLRLTLEENEPKPSFNQQENEAIEWAQWSWNPVTGCLHTCSYCYARDIALSRRMEKVYPNGFAPTFRPSMTLAPRFMKVPKEAATDTRYRNVFTCSMADLFGRWVPKEWIQAVLDEIRAAPQWNFLCLTKFPKRMAEFEIPDNAWMGTTVDLQARVPAAEAAFAKVNAGVKWLSIEPMLEPLKFKNLERFDWIVVGGSSRSSQTPEWCPPFEWVLDLINQMQAAGMDPQKQLYMKTNLGMKKRLLGLPFDAPIPSDNTPAPKEFHYLGKGVE